MTHDEGDLRGSGVTVTNIVEKNSHLNLAAFSPPIAHHSGYKPHLDWKEPLPLSPNPARLK